MQPVSSRRFSDTIQAPSHINPKRITDLGLGLTMCLLLAPLLAFLALLLWVQGGPVIYGHRRVGQYGREFTVWKFRTMVREADRKLPQLLEVCPHKRIAWARTRKLDNDPRITRIGRLLRRASLDELPQLWNVICGEMSLVGPRPVPREELREKYGLVASAYETIKPGMTGLWQVSGRNSLRYEERVALDERYIRTRNAWMDARIILCTPWTVLRCKGS